MIDLLLAGSNVLASVGLILAGLSLRALRLRVARLEADAVYNAAEQEAGLQ